MPPIGYFVDASLLTLLVVGSLEPELITKHRRLQGYFIEDFDLLNSLLGNVETIFVTPNTLTEASNLLAQHGEPERSRLLEYLRLLIERSEEIVVVSREASHNDHFQRLGLTDAALLEVVKPETPLLTVDVALYLEAQKNDAAVNFTHLRTYLDA